MPFPAVGANKYSRGKLTLVVGSAAYPGAACLSSRAGQCTGSGYCEVLTSEANVDKLQLYRASLVVRPWNTIATLGAIPASYPDKPCAYVIGCGFDVRDEACPPLLRTVLAEAQAPVLVDGSAIRHLSSAMVRNLCENRASQGLATVVTPHGGEAASMAEVFGVGTSDPKELALTLARAYGIIVVLKGPDTVIADGHDAFTMNEGTAALAKAGTGDVLAGMIGGLLAQGMDPFDACVLGSTLHARAGRAAARRLTDIAVCAEDVIDAIPEAISETAWNVKGDIVQEGAKNGR